MINDGVLYVLELSVGLLALGINGELPGQPQMSKLNFKTLRIHSQVIRDKAISK